MEFVIEPGLTGVGDARLLEIALTNLLSNAVKFTGPKRMPESNSVKPCITASGASMFGMTESAST
jgi:signal transduction histidine kinase